MAVRRIDRPSCHAAQSAVAWCGRHRPDVDRCPPAGGRWRAADYAAWFHRRARLPVSAKRAERRDAECRRSAGSRGGVPQTVRVVSDCGRSRLARELTRSGGKQWRSIGTIARIRRPRLALRRLAVTLSKGPFTIDAGKAFIRWARADVLNPTDRFAPRDFMNVLDTDVLPVIAVHPSLRFRNETFEAVWSPQLTPSRLPLFNQRWTVLPPAVQGIPIVDGGSILPSGSEQGVRWSHAGSRFDASLSFFDGFNHLPNIETRLLPTGLELTRVFPSLRSYGGDLAIPTQWVTLKGEAAYFTSPTSTNDEYVLYVIELERQIREWVLVVGYAGEAVTQNRGVFSFAPDRGIAKSILGRAAYTVDPRRTVAIEAAVRQSGDGLYIKGEYSQAFAQHWRLTLTGVGIEGEPDDFLGQFNHNSNVSIALRFSF